MPTNSGGPRVRFGPFELDLRPGELYRDGKPIRLQEHPRQVLVALLERPGELVTRDDLRERLWKSDTFVDFEHGLNTAVKKARQALGDSADAPEFIETLARRGYRFIGRVESVDPRSAASIVPLQGIHAPRLSHPRRLVGRGILRSVALVALLVGAGATWLVHNKAAAPSSLTARSSAADLAVMPLRVLSEAKEESAYLGTGLADAITTRLAHTRQIGVRPTSAVLPFKDAQTDPAKVATSLGVQHLLLGTIQPLDQTYRVTIQLVRADGVAVWGRTFDEPRESLLTLQDHLAEQVVAALRVELSATERERLRARYTDNPAAYDLYLRGRSLLVNYTEANMHEAIRYFEEALEIDRNFALARAGIATACAWFSVRYAHETEALAWGRRADQEARLALEQDGSLADAHFAIASAAGTEYGGFNWNTVLERTAAALALDPSLDLARIERMRAYYHLGLFDAAREEGRLARAVNPSSSVALARLEIALLLIEGRFREAADQASPLLAKTDAGAIRHYLGLARYYIGDASGARELLAWLKRGSSPDVRSQASLASIEAAVGMQTDARARIAMILRGSDLDHHVAYSLGGAFAQLGDAAASVTWLERAADTGFPCLPWFERDSLLDPVRREPGFVRLVGRMRLAHDQARRGTR